MEYKKIFVVICEGKIVSVFSNMTLLANGCPLEDKKRHALYARFYRHFKAHEQEEKIWNDFHFEYEHDGKDYHIKVYLLNQNVIPG